MCTSRYARESPARPYRRSGARALFVTACVALAVGAEVLPAACVVPPLDETGKACTGERCPSGLPCVLGLCASSAQVPAEDAGSAADAALACTPPEGGNPCASIPRLVGAQTVDCLPTEFCNVPIWSLEASSGDGTPPALVNLQVAWSDAGLHVFASVKKWPVIPSTNGSIDLYQADAIELFVASSSASLSGKLTDDSIHFLATPPPNSMPGGEVIFFQPNEGPMTYVAPSGLFVGCLVPEVGYDMEVQLPWGLPWLPQNAPPQPGDTIGFDFAIDVLPPTGDAGRTQTFEDVGPTPSSGATNQCKVIAMPEAPYCDDRCWCTPTVR